MSKLSESSKVEIMALAVARSRDHEYEKAYKKMIDLITNYEPEPKDQDANST